MRNDTYRTNDGRAHFEFTFREESGGTWRADIESQPSYNGREDNLERTRRLRSSTARTGHKICFKMEQRSLRDIQKFAETWAEASWEYSKTGRLILGFEQPH